MEPWQQPAGEECPSTEFPADGRTVAAALGCRAAAVTKATSSRPENSQILAEMEKYQLIGLKTAQILAEMEKYQLISKKAQLPNY